MDYITVEGLTYQYDKEPILEDISLKLRAGEFVVLTGENGSAKSTLMRAILGLSTIKAGKVNFAKKNTAGEPLLTAYIKQDATHYNPSFPSTVYQLVASGRYPDKKWFKRLTQADHALVKQALEQVSMWPYREQSIGGLSGGQKQRVQIARALAMEADVYLLDEPTTGMDERSRQEMYALLSKKVDDGKAVLMVTHDNDEWMGVADRHMRLVRKEDTPWRCFNLISLDVPSL